MYIIKIKTQFLMRYFSREPNNNNTKMIFNKKKKTCKSYSLHYNTYGVHNKILCIQLFIRYLYNLFDSKSTFDAQKLSRMFFIVLRYAYIYTYLPIGTLIIPNFDFFFFFLYPLRLRDIYFGVVGSMEKKNESVNQKKPNKIPKK